MTDQTIFDLSRHGCDIALTEGWRLAGLQATQALVCPRCSCHFVKLEAISEQVATDRGRRLTISFECEDCDRGGTPSLALLLELYKGQTLPAWRYR